MKKSLQLLAMLVIVALVAVGACFFTFKFLPPLRANATATHEAIHKQLHLSADQEKALELSEDQFHQRHRELLDQIRSANKELAQAIREDQVYSSRLEAAIGKIRNAQGELQQATLEHVFAMRAVLTPTQYQKLLDLTADQLNELNRDQ